MRKWDFSQPPDLRSGLYKEMEERIELLETRIKHNNKVHELFEKNKDKVDTKEKMETLLKSLDKDTLFSLTYPLDIEAFGEDDMASDYTEDEVKEILVEELTEGDLWSSLPGNVKQKQINFSIDLAEVTAKKANYLTQLKDAGWAQQGVVDAAVAAAEAAASAAVMSAAGLTDVAEALRYLRAARGELLGLASPYTQQWRAAAASQAEQLARGQIDLAVERADHDRRQSEVAAAKAAAKAAAAGGGKSKKRKSKRRKTKRRKSKRRKSKRRKSR